MIAGVGLVIYFNVKHKDVIEIHLLGNTLQLPKLEKIVRVFHHSDEFSEMLKCICRTLEILKENSFFV